MVIEGGDEPMIVVDAHDDPRFNQNPIGEGESKNCFLMAGYAIKIMKVFHCVYLCGGQKNQKIFNNTSSKGSLKIISTSGRALLETS